MINTSDNLPVRRVGRQIGPMEAILQSQGSFQIRDLSGKSPKVALQISRNLHQYFGADSIITTQTENETAELGNVIDLYLVPTSSKERQEFPAGNIPRSNELRNGFLDISHTADKQKLILLIKAKGRRQNYEIPTEGWGLGGVFLSPLENERLSLVVWGTSTQALQFAARFVPMLTGVGQPDFILCSEKCTWKGAEGTLAMGFYDHVWEITATSFVA